MFLDKTSFWRVFGTSEYLLLDMFSLKIFAMRESTILADILTNFAEMQSFPMFFFIIKGFDFFMCSTFAFGKSKNFSRRKESLIAKVLVWFLYFL